MKPIDTLGRITTHLARQGVPYLVDGDFAAGVWGGFDSGLYAEVVIDERAGTTVDQIAFRPNEPFDVDRPPESWDGETSLWTRVLHGDDAFHVTLNALQDDPFERSRFERRVTVRIAGYEIAVPTPEDVIVGGLRWAAASAWNRDAAHARDVLHFQAASLDLAYVRHWCDRHETREPYERIRRESFRGLATSGATV